MKLSPEEFTLEVYHGIQKMTFTGRKTSAPEIQDVTGIRLFHLNGKRV